MLFFPGHQAVLCQQRGNGKQWQWQVGRFLQLGEKRTLLSNQRSCGCKSGEQILSVSSGSLVPDTDTVTGSAWQKREIKEPVFGPENRKEASKEGEGPGWRQKGGKSRKQSHKVVYELLAYLWAQHVWIWPWRDFGRWATGQMATQVPDWVMGSTHRDWFR